MLWADAQSIDANRQYAFSPNGASCVTCVGPDDQSVAGIHGTDLPSSGFALRVGDFVRLHGLKTAELINKVGEIKEFVEETGRIGVALHGGSSCKALLPKNLTRYKFSSDDMCPACADPLNLNAFLPCACFSRC